MQGREHPAQEAAQYAVEARINSRLRSFDYLVKNSLRTTKLTSFEMIHYPYQFNKIEKHLCKIFH